MTDRSNNPLDGEIIGPGDQTPGEKRKGRRGDRKRKTGASDADNTGKDGKPKTGKGFGRQQTEEERAAEEKSAEPFKNAVVLGRMDWRYADWEPSENDRRLVRMLKFCGNTDEDIGDIIGMSVETLNKFFPVELKHAKTILVADLANRAFNRAQAGNDILTMFLLKTRGGAAFSERAQTGASIGEAIAETALDAETRAKVIKSVTDALSGLSKKTTEDKQPEKTSKEGDKK